MKLIDALNNVDKTHNNKNYIDYPEIAKEFGFDGWCINYQKADERMSAYHLIKWLCSDTWVGTLVYYLDGNLVAYSTQSARKSSKLFYFVSNEAAEKTREFLLSVIPEDEIDKPDIDDNLDREIADGYTVEYANQFIQRENLIHEPTGKVVDFISDNSDHKNIVIRDRSSGKYMVANINSILTPLSVVDCEEA